MAKETISARIPGFYKLGIEERRRKVAELTGLDSQELAGLFTPGALGIDRADHMVENVIGTFELPLGVGLNFLINNQEVIIPMVIEEPSVVAGASFMARLARAGGGFRTHTTNPEMIGQIQILDLVDPVSARLQILEQKSPLLAAAAEIDPILLDLGGGPRDLEVRLVHSPHLGPFLVVHLIYDVRDAMGANAVNTACEQLAPRLESITGGRVHLRILSNLADHRLARARCTIPLSELAFESYPAEVVRDGIIEAWSFAAVDPYRAATHNKGIMNGIDSVLIATGNDWRAVEAGAHAYAARSGQYTSLSTWGSDASGNLTGSLELPLAVGIVGGATKVHPAAQAALALMKVKTASQLAEIIAAAGLAQNLAALRALATEGIQRGHMSLHARQVAIAAGAPDDLVDRLAQALVEDRNVRIDRAQQILKEWGKNG